MKSFILFFLLLVATAYIAVAYFKPVYTEVGGINAKSKSVKLWKSPTTKSTVVTKLHSGTFAKLSATKTKWNNFYKVNGNQAILKKDFKLGYSRVFKQFVLKSEELTRYEGKILKFSPWVIVGLLAWLFTLLISSFFRFISGKRKLTKSAVLLNNIVTDENFSQEDFNEKVDKKVAEKLQNERDKLIREFNQSAKEEITPLELGDNTDVDLRGEAYEKLKHAYDEAVERGRVMGVDLEGSNIDGLVKGRLFELFAAKVWDNDSETTIEDWTSDKGIFEGFYVKSNGNPDFLLSFAGKKIAVECKYRSKPYNFKEQGLSLALDKKSVIDRYYGYKKENNIEVFILFGLGGTAKEPESLYLIQVGKCYDSDTGYDTNIGFKYAKNEKLAAKLSDIEPFKIKKYELVECVKSGIL